MTPAAQDLLSGLPGAQNIAEGLHDHARGRHSIASCLVRIARPRLAEAGFLAPATEPDDRAELDLYALLSAEGRGAYSRYNALLRELVSFEHALDHRMRRE